MYLAKEVPIIQINMPRSKLTYISFPSYLEARINMYLVFIEVYFSRDYPVVFLILII